MRVGLALGALLCACVVSGWTGNGSPVLIVHLPANCLLTNPFFTRAAGLCECDPVFFDKCVDDGKNALNCDGKNPCIDFSNVSKDRCLGKCNEHPNCVGQSYKDCKFVLRVDVTLVNPCCCALHPLWVEGTGLTPVYCNGLYTPTECEPLVFMTPRTIEATDELECSHDADHVGLVAAYVRCACWDNLVAKYLWKTKCEKCPIEVVVTDK